MPPNAAVDIHTHLYAPAFGPKLKQGIDDLLTYHYLVAETMRYVEGPVEAFWSLSVTAQADLVWQTLFVERAPVSEACRGVLTALHALGLETGPRELPRLRRWFAEQDPATHLEKCFELAGVSHAYMTNSPWDAEEEAARARGPVAHPRFRAALRLDPLLLEWPGSGRALSARGHAVSPELDAGTITALRRWLRTETARLDSAYVMVAWPWHQRFPDDSPYTKLMLEVLVPHSVETGQPIVLMIGTKHHLNPALRAAGHGVGLAALEGVEHLLQLAPQAKFAATALARENQHQLCVMARKFRHLHLFGCWWFLNNPVFVEEITRMRLAMLGLSFTAQHSDARVLEQLIYKWHHTRADIEPLLDAHLDATTRAGWPVDPAARQAARGAILGGEFADFSQRTFAVA